MDTSIFELGVAAFAGAASWGAIHFGFFRKKRNGHDTQPAAQFALSIIEQDNMTLRHEKAMLERENNTLQKMVLELEKRVHELEQEIKWIKTKVNGFQKNK